MGNVENLLEEEKASEQIEDEGQTGPSEESENYSNTSESSENNETTVAFATGWYDSTWENIAPKLEEKGIETEWINPKDIVNEDAEDYKDKTVVWRPATAMAEVRDSKEDEIWESVKEWEQEGVNFYNNPHQAEMFDDKERTKRFLEDRKIGTPKSYRFWDAWNKVEDDSVVAKPNVGEFGGRGVEKIQSKSDLLNYTSQELGRDLDVKDLIFDDEVIEEFNEKVVLEQHIDKSRDDVEERRMYLDSDGVRAIKKRGGARGFAQNINQGASYSDAQTTFGEFELYSKIQDVEGTTAVDYCLKNLGDEEKLTKAVVMELNASPGDKIFDGNEEAEYEIADSMAKQARNNMNQYRSPAISDNNNGLSPNPDTQKAT